MDRSKGFDPDLFFNFILLTEELGEVASELVKIWGESRRQADGGRPLLEAQQAAVNVHRDSLRTELADLLAYVIKLANYTGIDLEKAYQEKMRTNLGRDWPENRTTAKNSKP